MIRKLKIKSINDGQEKAIIINDWMMGKKKCDKIEIKSKCQKRYRNGTKHIYWLSIRQNIVLVFFFNFFMSNTHVMRIDFFGF